MYLGVFLRVVVVGFQRAVYPIFPKTLIIAEPVIGSTLVLNQPMGRQSSTKYSILSTAMNFAILGPGLVADYHVTAIEANKHLGASLRTIIHYEPSKFEGISEKYGVPCQSLEAALADTTLDAVCICTPSGQHARQAIACIEAGKHVLIEKPMALRLADADAMIAAAKANNVHIVVAFQRRTEPLFLDIKRAIMGGDLGQLTMASVVLPYFRGQTYYDQAPWRGTWAEDGGGVLMNQGIHIIDLLVWYMGDPVDIKAHAGTLLRDIEVEDVLAASLKFSSGAVATVTATTTTGDGAPHRLELYGTNGCIQVTGETATRWYLKDKTLQTVVPHITSEPVEAGASSDPRGIKAVGHTALIKTLITAVNNGQTAHINGIEGRRSLATVNGIYRAAGLIQDV
ncbi:MAG: Gfo/Idh/MocA family oxidoreductase [Bacteroidota bacterium]